MSNAAVPAPPRRLSSRRGSWSASDPFGHNAEAETARATASRITIVRAPQPVVEPPPRHRDRTSWGSAHSTSSSTSSGRAPGRLSFAFSSFTPINGPASPGKGGNAHTLPPSGPPSPGGPPQLIRSNSGHSLDRMSFPAGRPPNLTPQQICDLAVNAISHPPSITTPSNTQESPSTFLLLPDEQYLPFLDRPSEVTALLTSSPTSRLMALLSQTFPADLRVPYDPSAPHPVLNKDPAKWSFADLCRWLQTTTRTEANDREWVMKSRTCVLSRSELIWSRLKAALGVPPELEEDEDEDYEEDELMGEYIDEPEAILEPILVGDTATCVASPLQTPDVGFNFDGQGGMESIGERPEAEEEAATISGTSPLDDSHIEQAIQGLRISTAMVEIQSQSRNMPSATPMRRSLSVSSIHANNDEKRRSALAMAGPGRVRRSAQQERGTGDPLFPSSFATLTMSPSLVAK